MRLMKYQSVKCIPIGIVIPSLLFILFFNQAAAQILETETARFLAPNEFQAGNAFEYQTSAEGTESAVPLAFEYGISKRWGILVEPVAFTQISPNNLTDSTPVSLGIGDLETTLEFLLTNEKKILPALAVAAEAKLPTATNVYIGSGKTDLAFYLMASKKIHAFDFHANLTYTIVGSPDGIELTNTWGGALASEFFISEKFELFGEVLGVTSSTGGLGETPDGGNPSGVILTPEASGGELVGTLGIAYRLKSGLQASFGTSYDNNNAFLFRPGITMNFK